MTRRRGTSGLRVIPIEPGSLSAERLASASNASHEHEEFVSRRRDCQMFRANVSVRFSCSMQELGCWSSESDALNGHLRDRDTPWAGSVCGDFTTKSWHPAQGSVASVLPQIAHRIVLCFMSNIWSAVQLGGSGRDNSAWDPVQLSRRTGCGIAATPEATTSVYCYGGSPPTLRNSRRTSDLQQSSTTSVESSEAASHLHSS